MYLKRVPPSKYMKQIYEEPPFGHVSPAVLPGHISKFYRLMWFPIKNDVFPQLEDVILTPDVRKLLDNSLTVNISISQIGEVKKSKDSEKVEDLLAIVSLESDVWKGGRTWVINKNGPIASIPENPKEKAMMFFHRAAIVYVNNNIYVITHRVGMDDTIDRHDRTTRIMKYPTMKDVFGSPYHDRTSVCLDIQLSDNIYKPQYDQEYGEFVYEHDQELRKRLLLKDDKVYFLLRKPFRDGKNINVKMGFIDENGKDILGWHDKIEYSPEENLVRISDVKDGATKVTTHSLDDIL